MRQAQIKRKTTETDIAVSINLDGTGRADSQTGIGFFDHMLTLLARHALIDLAVQAKGDLEVDGHHTIEDVGIALGQALYQALGEKRGIRRYGHAVVPMDEAVAEAVLDCSGRAYLVFDARFGTAAVGAFPTQMTVEFFRALADQGGLTLHLHCPYGQNDHHKIEALFKAFARALRQAVELDPRSATQIPSTKEVL